MSSSGGGDGFGSSSAGSVRAARDATDDVQERFSAARKNPEKELGIPLDELERRQRKACEQRQFVSDASSRKFDVKSSARAQQIMNQGIDAYQREKRKRDLKSSLSILRKMQVVLCVFSAGFFGWLAATYLLPQYRAVQDRNRRMQLRYERAQRSLEGIRDSGTAAAAGTGSEGATMPPVGPVVRVFRVGDQGECDVTRAIQ